MYAPPNQYIPQRAAHRRSLLIWAIVTGGSLLLVALIVGAPLARANGFVALAFPLYQAFSHVCHQAPDRSLFVVGNQLAVCARCTGIYFGFAGAVICYPLITSLRRTQTPQRKWLLIAAVPLLIDFGLTFLGIWPNTHWSRFSTGALLAAVAVYYVMPGLVEVGLRFRSLERQPEEKTKSQTVQSVPTKDQIATAPSDYSAPFRRI